MCSQILAIKRKIIIRYICGGRHGGGNLANGLVDYNPPLFLLYRLVTVLALVPQERPHRLSVLKYLLRPRWRWLHWLWRIPLLLFACAVVVILFYRVMPV